MNEETKIAISDVEQLDVAQMKDEELEGLNPHVAEAIRAIQAERSGAEMIEWSDFSSHTQRI